MKADVRTHPLRLVFAGIQPILYGWAVLVVLGIFSYTIMADSPSLGTTTWQDVAGVVTGWWLTAFGGSLHFDGVAISLPPLLITLVTFLGLYFFVRKLPVTDWKDTSVFVVAAGATTALLGQLAPAGSNWWLAVVGMVVLAFLAVLSSKNRTDWFGAGFFNTPAGRAIYDGLILARRVIVAALVLGTIGFVTAVVLGWSDILSINSYYILQWHSNVFMWLFQICYVPTLIVWSLAYMVGAGFAVGTGTSFSALGAESAPLPAVPILGALPQPGSGTPWIIAIVVLVVFLLGMRQSAAFPDMKEALITGAIHVGFVAIIASILGALAQGSIGPERLAITGPEAPPMAGLGALVLGLPMYLGMIANHRTARAKYVAWWKNVREKSAAAKNKTAATTPRAGDDAGGDQSRSEHRPEEAVEVVDDGGAGSPANPHSPTSTTAITAHTAPEAGRKKP